MGSWSTVGYQLKFMNCDIDFLLSVLIAAKEKGAKTVNFYRGTHECKTNPDSLDFVLDRKDTPVENMLVYGDKPDQVHLEIPIISIYRIVSI